MAGKLSVRGVGHGFSGKLYPNGEFGISRVRLIKSPRTSKAGRNEGQEWRIHALRVHGLQSMLHCARGTDNQRLSVGLQPRAEVEEPLVSTPRANSHRAKRGSKGIASNARRMVRNGVHLIESTYGVKRLSFLTLTVPDLQGEQWYQLVAGWSNIVRVFLQWLRRRLIAAGLPGSVVSVTELQEERTSREGVPALHLHMVFVGRKKGKTWEIVPSEFRESWLRAMGGEVEKLSECKFRENCENVQSVRSSAENYLGKYMSKGLKAVEKHAQILEQYGFPPTWYNLTRTMRTWIKQSIKTLPFALSYYLWNLVLEKDKDTLIYSYAHQVQTRFGYPYLVGVSGKIARSTQNVLMKTKDTW